MPLLPALPQIVPFDEVAAILDTGDAECSRRTHGGAGDQRAPACRRVGSGRASGRTGHPLPPADAVSINIPPNKRRDALLRMKLAELASWHLLATCATCSQDRVVSIRSLIEHFGPEVALIRLMPRFRCGVPGCRLPPAKMVLRNRLPVHPGPPLIAMVLLDARGGRIEASGKAVDRNVVTCLAVDWHDTPRNT